MHILSTPFDHAEQPVLEMGLQSPPSSFFFLVQSLFDRCINHGLKPFILVRSNRSTVDLRYHARYIYQCASVQVSLQVIVVE